MLATHQASFRSGAGAQNKGKCFHLSAGAWDLEASRDATFTAESPRPPVRGLSAGGKAQLEPTSRVPTHHYFQTTVQLHKIL